jgi:hypothetical protein
MPGGIGGMRPGGIGGTAPAGPLKPGGMGGMDFIPGGRGGILPGGIGGAVIVFTTFLRLSFFLCVVQGDLIWVGTNSVHGSLHKVQMRDPSSWVLFLLSHSLVVMHVFFFFVCVCSDRRWGRGKLHER